MDKPFLEKQPAAVLKHELLRRYLPVFVAATGKTSRNHRVVYFDGFAGTGQYESGEPGSPLLAASTASFFRERGLRSLRCHYVEQDARRYERLKASLAGVEHEHEVHLGTAETVIDRVLEDANGLPMFAFLDPFGLIGIPCEDLVLRILDRPVRETEVLLNFSVATLRRRIGHVRGDHAKARNKRSIETILDRTDLALGGQWWRDIAAVGGDGAEREIYKSYRERLREKTGHGWFSVPVRRRLGRRPIYFLLFFSRHNLGHWKFNESLSHAWELFVRRCWGGQEPLFSPNSEIESRLYDHLKRTLLAGRSIRIGWNLGETFGRMSGVARETHLRRAIKRLYAEGLTRWEGKGILRGGILSPARGRE